MVTKSMSYTIHNVVVTADLKQVVEITRFNKYSWGRYDIEHNYNGRVGYVKDNAMTGRVTVFLSGKLISTGAKSIPESNEQLYKTMKHLVSNKFVHSVPLQPKTQNIVATTNVGHRVDMTLLVRKVSNVIYEPDQFAGAILRNSDGSVCLIFASGKIVMVGLKSQSQLKTLANRLQTLLRNC